MGIEAARNAIVKETIETMREQGVDTDIRHLLLVADAMTNSGEIKAIGRETTFEKDTRDPEVLLSAFAELFEDAFAELKEKAMLCRTVTVVCRFSGFETHTKSRVITPTKEKEILKSEAVKQLLRFVMEYQKPIRLIGVRFAVVAQEEV